MKFSDFIFKRQILNKKMFTNFTFLFAVVGMAIGVATMIISMALFSGFKTTLTESIVDIVGDVNIARAGGGSSSFKEVVKKLKQEDKILSFSPYLNSQVVLVANQSVYFSVLTGVQVGSADNIKNLKKRLVSGNFNIGKSKKKGQADRVVIGKGIAQKFGLKVNDEFNIALPIISERSSVSFEPKIKKFIVSGIIDLGIFEFNERVILADLKVVQNFSGHLNRYSGIRLKLKDHDMAPAMVSWLQENLNNNFKVSYWRDVEPSLFHAIDYEKIIIFGILSIIILVASFNISSTLYISVIEKYADISIYKTIGARPSQIVKWFLKIGLFYGSIGVAVGILLGFIGVFALNLIQNWYQILPPDIYKLGKINLKIHFFDVALVVLVSYLICLLSVLAPAFKGSQLNPVKGLSYE